MIEKVKQINLGLDDTDDSVIIKLVFFLCTLKKIYIKV